MCGKVSCNYSFTIYALKRHLMQSHTNTEAQIIPFSLSLRLRTCHTPVLFWDTLLVALLFFSPLTAVHPFPSASGASSEGHTSSSTCLNCSKAGHFAPRHISSLAWRSIIGAGGYERYIVKGQVSCNLISRFGDKLIVSYSLKPERI